MWDKKRAGDGDWVLYPHPYTPRTYGPDVELPGEGDPYGYGMGYGSYGDYSPPDDDDTPETAPAP
jgi:hypothetical protein